MSRQVTALISRRLFLRGGAAAAGSLFFALAGAGAQNPAPIASLRNKIKGRVLAAQDSEFKAAAYGGLWNRLLPDRAPHLIVSPLDDMEVIEAVKFARSNGLKVAVRGGGHNWCAPSVRNGGVMIDLSNLNKIISVDPEKMRAVTQPVVSNREMQKALNAHGLAFPTGHCPPVKLSGYLLSGGMSWNQGVWGPGMGSIEAIEMVTPEGRLITASQDENADYFWAARGAGPGLFAVAVRYHLKLYPLPRAIASLSYTYPLDQVETVADWLGKTAGRLPPFVELSLFMLPAPPELAEQTKEQGGKICLVAASIFADTMEEAKKAVKPLDECPVISKCLSRTEIREETFESLFDMSGALWPEGLRCKVEATFSNAGAGALFNSVRKHYADAPSPLTVFMYAFFTGANIPAPLPDASFSMSARLYGGPWTMWKSADDDEVNIDWHNKCVKLIRPYVSGYYVAEADTAARPETARESYSQSNWRRLSELRKKYDPTGVFYSYSDGFEKV